MRKPGLRNSRAWAFRAPSSRARARAALPSRARALVALSCSALAASALVPAAAAARGDGPSYVPGELLVRFDPGVDKRERSAIVRGEGAAIAEGVEGVPGLTRVTLAGVGAGVGAAERRLDSLDGVRYAEPNFRYEIAEDVNDPFFGSQWGLENTGQFGGSVLDADIDAEAAWGELDPLSLPAGSPDVTIAVIDTGMDILHPDLAPNLWENDAEVNGIDGMDDDVPANGKIDDKHGWNFVGPPGSETPDPSDAQSHGTHVAGIAGAAGDNGEGVSGVNWEVGLMPLRAADASGEFLSADIVEAIAYADRMGADVINASFGGGGPSQAQFDAIAAASDVLFVAAAGNGGTDNIGAGEDLDDISVYPCEYSLPNVICVASTTFADQLASSSNFGNDGADLAAPGALVRSTVPGDTSPSFTNGGFENVLTGTWVTGGTNDTWTRITPSAFAGGGGWSLTDSDGGPYADGTDSFVRRASPASFSGYSGCRVNADVEHDLGTGDTFTIEGATSESGPWTALPTATFAGTGSAAGGSYPVGPAFFGAASFHLRFHLVSDGDAVAGDGVDIDNVSIACDGAYGSKSGTSMATPHVAGAAALLLDEAPGYGVDELRSALLGNVDRPAALRCRVFTGGRLNLASSLANGAQPVSQDCPPVAQQAPAPQAVPGAAPNLLKKAIKRCKRKFAKGSKKRKRCVAKARLKHGA